MAHYVLEVLQFGNVGGLAGLKCFAVRSSFMGESLGWLWVPLKCSIPTKHFR